LATFVVMYVTLGLLSGTLTFEFWVEHVPFEPVVQDRVVVVPPVTAKVTVAPETGWPFWSATLTSTHELHRKRPINP
jgi:hypothetical protein